MLAYFFALRYITKAWHKCQKGNFALVVLRNAGRNPPLAVYRGGLNKKPHLKTRLADFSIMGQMVLLEFRFLALGGVQTTPSGLQGWKNKRRQPCKS